VNWYARTGATPPFADPSRDHGVAMEGTFWRFTGAGRAVIVLHGRCHGPDGPWSLVALAAHPGGLVDWAIGDDLLEAEPDGLRVRLQRASLEAGWSSPRPWPRRAFGALGPAQCVPWLGQYWHPHLLDGEARVALGGDASFAARVYSERNWGSDFAGHWWWGQAHVDAATVAFAGGRLFGQAPTAVVVALEDRVLRVAPPLARVATSTAPGEWRIRAGGVEIEASADPADAHVLPVPVPSGRDVVMRSRQHLAGRLALTVRRRGGIVFRGETEFAGLERGMPPA
jgi:hypothetical protein